MKFLFVQSISLLFLFSCGVGAKNDNSRLYDTNDSDLENQKKFPVRPDLDLTPGSLCEFPSERRYSERIKYCDRDVEVELKQEVFATYDIELGYKTQQMKRQDFKIDHLIPLCMGGSNTKDNLWPQYIKIYTLTDPVEPMLCSQMAEGKLTQEKAVRLIREIKQDPTKVDEKLAELN